MDTNEPKGCYDLTADEYFQLLEKEMIIEAKLAEEARKESTFEN